MSDKPDKLEKPHASRWTPTPEVLAQIEILSKQGLTEASIARNIDLHPSTFSSKKTDFPEITEAIEKGRAVGEGFVVSKLWGHIEKGNLNAIQFWLTRRGGWRETAEVQTQQDRPDGFTFVPMQKSA